MLFRSILVPLALALAASSTSAAPAPKKKAAKPAANTPIQFEVKNGCAAAARLDIAGNALAVEPGQTAPAQTLVPQDEWSYPAKLSAPAFDFGQLSMSPGGRYLFEVRDCRATGADLLTKDLAERPAGKSPQAAAQVRFRSQQNLTLEYRSTATGRFMPVSMALTSYKEQPGGDYHFSFRLRAA